MSVGCLLAACGLLVCCLWAAWGLPGGCLLVACGVFGCLGAAYRLPACLHPPHHPDLCEEAGTSVNGGQTVLNPWMIVGGVATYVAKAEDYIK